MPNFFKAYIHADLSVNKIKTNHHIRYKTGEYADLCFDERPIALKLTTLDVNIDFTMLFVLTSKT